MNAKSVLSRGLCGSILVAVGMFAFAACTVEVPEDDGAENVGEVSQALVSEGGWCGPPFYPSCEAYLDCCVTTGHPGSWICRNLQIDEDNCGECGNECSGYAWWCSDGECGPFGE